MGTLNGVTNDFLLKVKIKVYSFSFALMQKKQKIKPE
jgi:hypothetical protein